MAIQTADVIMPGTRTHSRPVRAARSRRSPTSTSLIDRSSRKMSTATLATIKRNGLPQLTPIWIAHDGTHILVNTKKGPPQGPQHAGAGGRGDPVCQSGESVPLDGHQRQGRGDDRGDRSRQGPPGHRQRERDGPALYQDDPLSAARPKGEVRVLFKVRPTYVMTFGPPPTG